jgi:hypothetical protein
MPGMALALSIFGVAFVAFFVWLTVRTINRRERWAKRTLAVVAGVPALYVLSFGPACWWFSTPLPPRFVITKVMMKPRYQPDEYRVAPRLYWPLGSAIRNVPQHPASKLLLDFAVLRIPAVMVPHDLTGKHFIGCTRPRS